jgi:hypothetical protein
VESIGVAAKLARRDRHSVTGTESKILKARSVNDRLNHNPRQLVDQAG